MKMTPLTTPPIVGLLFETWEHLIYLDYFLVLAENLKRRASVILDSTESAIKENPEEGNELETDNFEKQAPTEVLCNPTIEATSQKSYQSPLERCLSARESRMRRRSISDA